MKVGVWDEALTMTGECYNAVRQFRVVVGEVGSDDDKMVLQFSVIVHRAAGNLAE